MKTIEQKKEIALQLKKVAGAMHIFVEYRYENVEQASVLLYSDAQRDFVQALADSGDSYYKDFVQEICSKENADWTTEELKSAYWEIVDIRIN